MISRLERPLTGRTWIALGIAGVLLIAALAVCVVGLDHRAVQRSAAADRTAVSQQAGEAVAAVFSVSARTWREDRRAAREHLAPPLSTTLREALNSGPPTGVDSVAWEPLRRATVDVDGDAATALVVARVSVTPSGAPEQVAERTVQASLVRVDGRWLLTGLDELR